MENSCHESLERAGWCVSLVPYNHIIICINIFCSAAKQINKSRDKSLSEAKKHGPVSLLSLYSSIQKNNPALSRK